MIELSIPLIYDVGMKNFKNIFFLQIVYLIVLIMVFGCSNIILVEKSSQDSQMRFYAKCSKFAQDTIFHGLYSEWYPNGIKKYEVTYKNGKKNGRETQWDAFGYKVRETEYTSDQKDGVEIFWIGDGIRKRELQYKKGLQNGVEITYSDNGMKIKEEFYLCGKKDGIEYGYDTDGRKVYEVTYKTDRKNGQEIFYDYSAGSRPQSTIVNWVDGNVVK